MESWFTTSSLTSGQQYIIQIYGHQSKRPFSKHGICAAFDRLIPCAMCMSGWNKVIFPGEPKVRTNGQTALDLPFR